MSSPTVLIVDDDDELLHVLRLLFEFEDFFVFGEATNGVDAISLARRHQPDFVVLDYHMPHMDGKATAEVLRAVSPQTQVVAFSAVLNGKPEWADAYLKNASLISYRS
jgi:CheY-like chemotaxis protein